MDVASEIVYPNTAGDITVEEDVAHVTEIRRGLGNDQQSKTRFHPDDIRRGTEGPVLVCVNRPSPVDVDGECLHALSELVSGNPQDVETRPQGCVVVGGRNNSAQCIIHTELSVLGLDALRII